MGSLAGEPVRHPRPGPRTRRPGGPTAKRWAHVESRLGRSTPSRSRCCKSRIGPEPGWCCCGHVAGHPGSGRQRRRQSSERHSAAQARGAICAPDRGHGTADHRVATATSHRPTHWQPLAIADVGVALDDPPRSHTVSRRHHHRHRSGCRRTDPLGATGGTGRPSESSVQPWLRAATTLAGPAAGHR